MKYGVDDAFKISIMCVVVLLYIYWYKNVYSFFTTKTLMRGEVNGW